jgi:lactose/cellobiose-specific phosphotransferase system IIC component
LNGIEKFNRRLQFVARLADRPLIAGIRRGYMYLVPMLIIGAVIVAILNIPIPGFQTLMAGTFGEGWKTLPLIIHNATLQVISLSAVLCISYSLAGNEKAVQTGRIRSIYPVITAFASYVAFLTPKELTDAVVSAKAAGASSMFIATFVSVVSVKLLTQLHILYDRIVPERMYSYNGNSTLRQAFHLTPAILMTVFVFVLANMVWHHTALDETVSGAFMNAFHYLFMRQDIFSMIMIVLITQILWFFGIHGGNAFMEAYNEAQTAAAAAGGSMSIPKEFFDIFVYFGGAGSTLALVVALLIFGSRHSDRKLAKGALFPGLLNVNEPLIFGLPIVLNPYYFIPFLLAPVAAAVISYGFMTAGLMPFPTEAVTWTMPIFVSGYLATNSVAAILVQVICFCVAVGIYMPFVFISKLNQEQGYLEDFKLMTREIIYYQQSTETRVLNRADEIGSVARYLAREIRNQISRLELPPLGKNAMHMEYQPKSTIDGRVAGAEALLRWTHPLFGYISPMVILGIADEAKLSNALGRWIIRQSMYDMYRGHQAGYLRVKLSVNLSPVQLNTDAELGQYIGKLIREYNLAPEDLDFELTENAMILQSEQLQKTLSFIRQRGSDISIDDFGMGHSSLKYLFDFSANVVKLDASLVQDINNGEDRKIVIRAILDLCRKLDVKVVAEGVETVEQLEAIHALGADYFQGFYFSRALPYDAFLAYMDKQGTI